MLGSISNKLPKLIPSEKSEEDKTQILKIAGTIRFIADRARPDVLYYLNEAISGQYQNTLLLLKQISKYLSITKDREMIFKKNKKFNITAYCDASHLRTGDGKSRIAAAIFTNEESAPFTTFSTKVSENFTLISVSSCEAELKAIYDTSIHVEFYTQLVHSLGIELNDIPTIFTDNASAIEVLQNGEGSSKLRHLNVRIMYVHHLIRNNILQVKKVHTDDNKVDFLTKHFTTNKFEEAAKRLMGF